MLKQLIGLIGLTLTATVNAAIIDFGTVTRDTATGLDWLDVTETRGLSYSQVSAQLGIGGAYEGYRYATTAELDQLITNFGYVAFLEGCPAGLTNCDSLIAGDTPVVEQMINTLGDTYDAHLDSTADRFDASMLGAGYTYGILVDSPYANSNGSRGLALVSDVELVHRDDKTAALDNFDQANSAYGVINDSERFSTVGSFLVAPSSVPLPATVWLFGSALLSLAGVSRRRSAKVFSGEQGLPVD